MKIYLFSSSFFYHYNTQHNKENEQNSVCSISDEHLIDKKGIPKRSTLSSSEVRRLPCVVIQVFLSMIRKQSVKLRGTVSVVAKKLHQFFKKVE